MKNENVVGVILAAGTGTRIKTVANGKPKSLLKFNGRTLIENQIILFNDSGLKKIYVVGGYQIHLLEEEIDSIRSKIKAEIIVIENTNFSTSNMVYSLYLASRYIDESMLVSYADLHYSLIEIENIMKKDSTVCVTVDYNWRSYWKFRYGSIEYDLEVLKINSNSQITEIGKETKNPEMMDARFVGLIKFSEKIAPILKELFEYKDNISTKKKWGVSGKDLKNAYMTDFISFCLGKNIKIKTVPVIEKWFEFDIESDFELNQKYFNIS